MEQEEGEIARRESAKCPPGAWRGALAGAGIAALLHLHLIRTPYLQDDYVGIANAYARVGVFNFPTVEPTFLRPVSVEGWWSLMTLYGLPWPETTFVVKLGLFVVAVALMGVVAAWIAAVRLSDANPGHASRRAFWATLLYGAHNAFFLPVAWGSGAQEILGLLFSGCALLAWMACARTAGWRSWCLALGAVLAQVLAHGSKEGTVALAVAVPLVLWLAKAPRSRIAMATILTLVVADIWLEIRSEIVRAPAPGSPYEYVFGMNMPRNAAALLAFAGGLPREAIQLFVVHRDGWALAWGVACLLLFTAGAVIALSGVVRRLPITVVAAPGLLFALALAPYVPLRWNCYPYYALFGLMGWPILVALAWGPGRRMRTAGSLIVASSVFCAAGQHWAPLPAPLARADRAGRVRSELMAEAPGPGGYPVLYLVGDSRSHLYADLGWTRGLALLTDNTSHHMVIENFDTSRDGFTTWRFHPWSPRRTGVGSWLPWSVDGSRGNAACALYFTDDRVMIGHVVDWYLFPMVLPRDEQGRVFPSFDRWPVRAEGWDWGGSLSYSPQPAPVKTIPTPVDGFPDHAPSLIPSGAQPPAASDPGNPFAGADPGGLQSPPPP